MLEKYSLHPLYTFKGWVSTILHVHLGLRKLPFCWIPIDASTLFSPVQRALVKMEKTNPAYSVEIDLTIDHVERWSIKPVTWSKWIIIMELRTIPIKAGKWARCTYVWEKCPRFEIIAQNTYSSFRKEFGWQNTREIYVSQKQNCHPNQMFVSTKIEICFVFLNPANTFLSILLWKQLLFGQKYSEIILRYIYGRISFAVVRFRKFYIYGQAQNATFKVIRVESSRYSFTISLRERHEIGDKTTLKEQGGLGISDYMHRGFHTLGVSVWK